MTTDSQTEKAPPGSVQPAGSEIRAMRDRVYGVPISDAEWSKCGENWMKPDETQWLYGQCAMLPNEQAHT